MVARFIVMLRSSVGQTKVADMLLSLTILFRWQYLVKILICVILPRRRICDSEVQWISTSVRWLTATHQNIRFIRAEKPCQCATHVKKIILQITAIAGFNRDGDKEAKPTDCRFKGAVCRILTVLKHKNTIICLQIFKKHAKLTLVYLKNNAIVSNPSLNMCGPARNVCVSYGLWNPPTASLPNCISAPRVASWRKTPRISFHSSSCALVPVGVVNLATCAWVKSEEEGLVKKNVSNILNLDCNT